MQSCHTTQRQLFRDSDANFVVHEQCYLCTAPLVSCCHVLLTNFRYYVSQVANNSIQLIAWAFKMDWQRHCLSLPELRISFVHAGDMFIGELACNVCCGAKHLTLHLWPLAYCLPKSHCSLLTASSLVVRFHCCMVNAHRSPIVTHMLVHNTQLL